MQIDSQLTPQSLEPRLHSVFECAARKILSIENSWNPSAGSPVFTVDGVYTSRGWTEWTQGFQYGSAILQFDATGEERFLELGRRGTVRHMPSHVSHVGVHDHGFNNVSTYGNLLRLGREGRTPALEGERNLYELALKVSGAVQAARWTRLADGTGFIHSFNGPHSLFVDTIRSCRALALAHRLGHVLMGEQDTRISLLQRVLEHAWNTARYNVSYGECRDAYDVRGRTAHEAVFNVTNGVFRCLNSQQGWSPFSTWTRGLAWAVCGFAELLDFLATVPEPELDAAAAFVSVRHRGRRVIAALEEAARATADYYLEQCCADGIPMWDTGAPNLHRLPADYLARPSDPYNPWEPVDSSAATIAAQGLWRLGRLLGSGNDHTARSGVRKVGRPKSEGRRPKETRRAKPEGRGRGSVRVTVEAGLRYCQAALTIARTLFAEPYLATDPRHQGLILHSVYHRPNGWDYVAPGQRIPNGESSMWGDYHARELALMLWRESRGERYPTFFGGAGPE